MPHKMSRSAYAQMFGPTVGDRVRLADTDLVIEVEKDFTTYGEEVKFGGGKVILSFAKIQNVFEMKSMQKCSVTLLRGPDSGPCGVLATTGP